MENSILKGLADNQPLMDTVKALILARFSTDKLTADLADIELGQMVRARLVGIKAVEDAFREIAQHRSISTGAPRQNPGA